MPKTRILGWALAILCNSPGWAFAQATVDSTTLRPTEREYPAHELLAMRASDGAPLSLAHLRRNAGGTGPVLMFMPGNGLTAYSMIAPVKAALAAGYEVYVAQPRNVSRSPDATRFPNNLRVLLKVDFPALLREVLRRSSGREVHIAGHSFGGLAAIAMAFDPDLGQEFAGKVKSATILMSSSQWTKMATWIHFGVSALLASSSGQRSQGDHLFDIFAPLYLLNRARGIPILGALAGAADLGLLPVVRPIFDREIKGARWVSDAALLTLLHWGVGPAPVDSYKDILDAVQKAQGKLAIDGRPLGDNLTKPYIRILTLAGSLDNFLTPVDTRVPNNANPDNLYVELKNVDHVAPMVADRARRLYDPMFLFHKSASRADFTQAMKGAGLQAQEIGPGAFVMPVN